ncbi:hypothetical protein HK100_010980 [Physocladia obscura]|uniref:Cupin type-2 domain-containing protein n=1 Tax=Physocladia obscura TaxID=109957 RepID=A0AAD5TAD0_9FUNG|nr:hypothetical protein HK100_010980 [Physocladia obscura]
MLVAPCTNLNENVDFFIDKLGFRVSRISPADDPNIAVLSGPNGYTVRLEKALTDVPKAAEGAVGILLRIECTADQIPSGLAFSQLVHAPNGLPVVFENINPPRAIFKIADPVQSLVITRSAITADGVQGRAGMLYSDLIPGRLGGAFILSEIEISTGGPVKDYVHYHQIRFQFIYVKKGWVRVVYEDQGEAFVMNAGDCVIQPPGIRHRVLESSQGLQVIEGSAPAVHDTYGDLEMVLPNTSVATAAEKRDLAVYDSPRVWNGQRFHFYRRPQSGEKAASGLRDLGMREASGGEFSLVVLELGKGDKKVLLHENELQFYHVLKGGVVVSEEELTSNDGSGKLVGKIELREGDSCAFPSHRKYNVEVEEDTEVLELTVPFSTNLKKKKKKERTKKKMFITTTYNGVTVGLASLEVGTVPDTIQYAVVTANTTNWLTFGTNITGFDPLQTAGSSSAPLYLQAVTQNTATFAALWRTAAELNDTQETNIIALNTITGSAGAFELRSKDLTEGLGFCDSTGSAEDSQLCLSYSFTEFAEFHLVDGTSTGVTGTTATNISATTTTDSKAGTTASASAITTGKSDAFAISDHYFWFGLFFLITQI